MKLTIDTLGALIAAFALDDDLANLDHGFSRLASMTKSELLSYSRGQGIDPFLPWVQHNSQEEIDPHDPLSDQF